MGLGVTVRGKVKGLEARSRSESECEQRVQVAGGRPENGRSNHGQDEADVRVRGGPNGLRLKTHPMSCG